MKPGLFPILFGGQPKTLFEANLETTLAPEKAASSTPTVSRTTTSTVVDFEGVPWTSKINESRFSGARRNENFLTFTEEFDNAAWSKANSTITTNATAAPDGTTTADKFIAVSTSTAHSVANAKPVISGHTYVQTIYAKAGEYNFIQIGGSTGFNNTTVWVNYDLSSGTIGNAGGGSYTSSIESVGNGWYRIMLRTAATSTTTGQMATWVYNTNVATRAPSFTGDDVSGIYIWGLHMEDVTGCTDTGYSEYLSNNVQSAPFKGAGVDSVAYYKTQKAGTAIATAKGYLVEGQNTNLVTQSQNFGTTWAAVGSPTRAAGNKKYGNLLLDLIGDDSAAAVEGYTETVTFTGNAQKSVSCFVKQGSSTKSVIVLRDTTAAADRLNVEITWSGAVPVVTMITGTEERAQEALIDGVYRLFFLTTSVTAANTNSLQVYPATDTALAILATGDINIGGMQAEDALFASSYIPTTTAAVTKTIDLLSYPVDTNLKTKCGVIYLQYIPETSTDFTGYLYGSYTDANNSFQLLFDGTTLTARKRVGGSNIDATISFNYVVGTTYKIGVKWGQNGINVFVNGVIGTANATATAPVFGTNISIGTDGNSSNACYGNIKNVKFYNKDLKDSKLIQLTT